MLTPDTDPYRLNSQHRSQDHSRIEHGEKSAPLRLQTCCRWQGKRERETFACAYIVPLSGFVGWAGPSLSVHNSFRRYPPLLLLPLKRQGGWIKLQVLNLEQS